MCDKNKVHLKKMSNGKMLKPELINAKPISSDGFEQTLSIIKKYGVTTVCEKSLCPNIVECWSNKFATFMIMGYTCTRNCGFCNIKTGSPAPLDFDEPEKIGLAVKDLGLKYVVLTSVARDDIPDGGAMHFANTIREIKKHSEDVRVEVLVSDFRGQIDSIKSVALANPDVFGHNIEVIRRLHELVKKPPSNYDMSIKFLTDAKQMFPKMVTKSGLMVGVGEEIHEILETFEDLRRANVDILTIGQYLSPSASHYKIAKYVTPEEFEEYREEGLKMGFKEVISGPLVRSSYKSGEAYSALCIR